MHTTILKAAVAPKPVNTNPGRPPGGASSKLQQGPTGDSQAAASAHQNLLLVFQSLAALTVQLVAWALGPPAPPSATHSGADGAAAAQPSAATTGSKRARETASYWHRSLVPELLWRLLEVWQCALAAELDMQEQFVRRLDTQLSTLVAAAAGASVERQIVSDAACQAALASGSGEGGGDSDGGDGDGGGGDGLGAPPQPPHALLAPAAAPAAAAAAGGPAHFSLPATGQLALVTAQRCRVLQEVQAAMGVLQAALWRLSALCVDAGGIPPPVASSFSVEDVLAGGALVLRMAPHPLRLVVAAPAARRPGQVAAATPARAAAAASTAAAAS